MKVTAARRILVADDRRERRAAIAFWLRRSGFEVLEAADAAELMSCIGERPDLVVLGSSLPGPSGFEITNRLKADPASTGTPIVQVVSGFTTGEWRAQGLEAGADAFLSHPVEPQELIATVRALLRVRAAEDEVRAAAEQWQVTFDAITDAVCLIDEDGDFIRCNAAADALLAQLGRGGASSKFHDFFPPPGDSPEHAVERLVEAGQPLGYELQAAGRWYAVRLDPIPRHEQVSASVVAVISDVTDRRRADEERTRLLENAERARREADISRFEAEAARREAEKASRAKSEFLAVMSHELRTPLNAIDGYAELIELEVRGPITAAQREDIKRIRRSQKHLLSLINDVLNFVRLDAGTVHYEIRPFALAEVIRDVEDMTGPQLRARGLRFARGDVNGIRVRADREKVEQILVNLMTNAIKFTEPDGEIALDCEAANGRVVVRVRDTGRGIPPDKLSAIFEPFVQVARSAAAPGEGIGLGLAISRELSRAMGGDLIAESRLGAGSTFTLTLPAA